MIRTTIFCFFIFIAPTWAQLDGVSEDQLSKEGLYIEAMGHALIGDYEDAIPKMKKFSAQEPTNFAPFYHLAKWYWQTDNLSEGLVQINKAEIFAPYNKEVLELKIDLLKENYQLLEAAEIAKKIWSLDSTSVTAAIRPVNLYIEATDLESADKWLDEVFDAVPLKDKSKSDMLELHLDVLLGLSNFEKAESVAMHLLDLYPEHLPYLYKLAKIYQAQNDIAREKEVLERVAENHPGEWKATLRLVKLDSDENLFDYLNGIKPILSNSEVAVSDRAELLTKEISNYTISTREERQALFEASKLFYMSEKAHPLAQSLFVEAAAYHGQWQDVVDGIREIRKNSRSQIELNDRLRFIDLLIKAKRYENVVEWGEELLLKYPNNGELYLQLAHANALLGNKGEADYYLSAADRMLRSNTYLRNKAHIIRFMSEKKSNSETKPWFEKEFDKKVASEVELLNLFLALKFEMPFSTAWLDYISSVQSKKEFTYLVDLTQALALFQKGDIVESEKKLEACWDTGAYTDPEAYELKYKIAVHQNQLEKAEKIKTELINRGVPWRKD